MRAAEAAEETQEAKGKKAAVDRPGASGSPGCACLGLGRPLDGRFDRRGQTAHGEDSPGGRSVHVQDDGHTADRSVRQRDGVSQQGHGGPRGFGTGDRDVLADADPALDREVAE